MQLQPRYIHNATLHWVHRIAPQLQLQLQLQLPVHYTTATATLYHTTQHNATRHYTALRYTNCTTPHHDYNCNCTCSYTNHTTVHDITTTAPLHYTTLHHTTLHCSCSCSCVQIQLQVQLRYTTLHPAVVVRWPLQPLQPFQKSQLQPPVGPSVDSLCHPWFTTTNLSYRFPIFETSATALCSTTGNS